MLRADADALRARLERFLFAPVDARVAAAFRIALAVLLALDFRPLGESPSRLAHVLGVAPLYEPVFLAPAWRTAALGGIALFGLGWRPRLVAAALAPVLAPLVLVSGAGISRQVLLLALLGFGFLQSGERWAPGGRRGADTAGPMWPVRFLQIELSVLYAVNAWAKATPEFLRGDVLVALSRTKPNFLADLADGFFHLGPLAIPVWLCAVGTLAVEAWLAVGFWIPRLRWATAALGVAFHVGIRLAVVRVFLLDWAAMLLYLAFLLPFERRDRSAPTPRSAP